MKVDWQTTREEFPVLREWVYLNSASFGPVPASALDASLGHFRQRDEKACLDFLDWYTAAEHVRAQAARWVGAAADDIAFIPNAGTALSWLLQGIDWHPGDQVLAPADEFPNNLYAPRALQGKGVEFVEVSSSKGIFSLDKFFARLTPRTRLVLLSSVNYATGLRPPLDEIGAELRRRGVLFFVDGTQSVGALRMDVGAAKASVLAVHAYKWMLCPTGIGFAYVSPQVREWLDPSVYSWRSHKNWRQVDCLHQGAPELPSAAMKYEGGMQNFPGLFALGAVLDLLHRLGAGVIEERVLQIAARARDMLRSYGADLTGDRHPDYDSPIIAARFPSVDLSRLSVELGRRRIAVAIRQGNLRVSPHFFNNQTDLEQLEAALAQALNE